MKLHLRRINHRLLQIRITAYNVCYTKWLRILGVTNLCFAIKLVNSLQAYCTSLSEWNINSWVIWRFLVAIFQAGIIVSAVCNVWLNDQLITWRSNKSTTVVKYNQPCRVLIYVISDTHVWLILSGLKFLSKMFAATGWTIWIYLKNKNKYSYQIG